MKTKIVLIVVSIFFSNSAFAQNPPIEDPANPIPDRSFRPNQTWTIPDLNDHFSDPDVGDVLSFALISASDQSVTTASITGTSIAITTKPTTATLTNTITVQASDGTGRSVDADFLVTVSNPPEESTSPIPDRSLYPNQTWFIADLNDHFDDPDGDALTFTLTSTQEQSVTTAIISGVSMTITTKPTAFTQTNTITVNVSDGYDGAVDFDLIVTVINNPPEERAANPIPDSTFRPNQTWSIADLNAHFSDPDGDALTFELVSSPDQSVTSASISGSLMSINTSPTAYTQTDTITVRIRDANNRAADF